MKQTIKGALAGGTLLIACLSILAIFRGSTTPEPKKNEPGKVYFQQVPVPDSLSFAGEKVPLEYQDVYESLDRELLVNSYFHSQTIRFIKMAPRYLPIIEPILKAEGIPDDFKYLALAESGFDPRAASPAGAVGFWQFLKTTGKEYGLEVGTEVDERYHIEKSTAAACRYLKKSFEKYNSWALVAASYNAGPAFVSRQLERQKINSYYDMLTGEETGRYVFRILALKLIVENPEKYGFKVEERYPAHKTKLVEVKGAVPDLAEFARQHGTNYKLLKMHNPWLRETFLTNPANKTYEIKIPVEGSRMKQN